MKSVTAQSGAGDIPPRYEDYGCRVNAIAIDELFQRYEAAGFLYPEKLHRLAPFMPLVKDNWRRARAAGDLIHRVVTYEDPVNQAWATITSWRSSRNGWNTQHLVGVGSPAASRAVMLAEHAACLANPHHASHQNWFQRTNRFANKIFGSILDSLGASVASVGDLSYFFLPFTSAAALTPAVAARAVKPAESSMIRGLADVVRSHVFSCVEGLDDDINLECVDDLFRTVGLRRYRRVFFCESDRADSVAGVALAYRGPRGLNFSFIENRCDILVDPSLDYDAVKSITTSLLAAVAPEYADCPLQGVPVVVHPANRRVMCELGARHIRDYAQSIWLRDGYEGWYCHVHRFYEKALRAEHRRGLAQTTSVTGKAT